MTAPGLGAEPNRAFSLEGLPEAPVRLSIYLQLA